MALCSIQPESSQRSFAHLSVDACEALSHFCVDACEALAHLRVDACEAFTHFGGEACEAFAHLAAEDRDILLGGGIAAQFGELGTEQRHELLRFFRRQVTVLQDGLHFGCVLHAQSIQQNCGSDVQM